MNSILNNVKIAMPQAFDASTPTFTTATESVNVSGYRRCLCILAATEATTASTVTLKQGTTSTASTELSFTQYWYNLDMTSGTTLTEGTASSNTFNTEGASHTVLYVIDVDCSTMTATYKYLRLNATAMTGATSACLMYIPYNPRYGNEVGSMQSVA